MIVNVILAGVFVLIASGTYKSDNDTEQLPAKPDWHTSEHDCSWRWVHGGGLGFWSEWCHLSTGHWSVVWDEIQQAFVLQNENEHIDIVVKPWKISPDAGISSLSKSLSEAGFLPSGNECHWQSVPIRRSPRTMSFYMLRSSRPDALKPTEQNEVPEPLCGPYGQSTHGVRYFIVDLRWPDLAVYVNEGQERPMFDPATITVLH